MRPVLGLSDTSRAICCIVLLHTVSSYCGMCETSTVHTSSEFLQRRIGSSLELHST